MSTNLHLLDTHSSSSNDNQKWKRRRDIPLAILAWIAVIAVVFWSAGHIVRSLLLLIIAALLAYALAPAVKFLRRFMPRILAILIVYLVVLSLLSLLIYLVVSTATTQVIALSRFLRVQLTSAGNGQPTPLEQTLMSFGITPGQIATTREQIIAQTETFASSAIPLLRGIFNFVLDTIIVAVLSIYLLIDGERMTSWLRTNMPVGQQPRVRFLLDTFQRIVGGYIRGQLFLSFLIGVLVGVGMFIFRVPYAVLLGVLAFIFSFVPVLGTFISGAICVLLALTQGWIIAIIVLAYFIGIHIFEGDLVGPRIVGKAIGLHPIVSLTALIAGSELFGIWGALFASPVAGILQALLVAIWVEWRANHPDQFHKEKELVSASTIDQLSDKPVDASEVVNP
jgi:predicted PurR-regulated permease PerM